MSKYLNPAHLLLAAGIACGLGLLVAGAWRHGGGADVPVQLLESEAIQAADELAEQPQQRHARLKRASLSMPYFSFARWLRPGN